MSLSNCMSFREIYLNNIKRDTVKNFIQTMPVFHWLDSEENWFTFYSNRNRLSNLVSKAATALQKQNIDDLFKKIKKYHRLEEVLYSKEVFKNFCQICFDANLNEDEINFISSKSKLSNYEGYQGKIVAPNEQKIIDIFNDYGPILNWWDLKELIKKNNVSEASFIMIMQYSVFFKRIDRATYTLSNQKIDFKNINNFKIDLSNESYSVQETEILKNQIAYIDVYDFGEFKLTMDYPRPLRRVMKDYKGVSFENQVYIVS